MKKILLTMLCTLLPLIGWAQENEPYAVLSDSNTVLTFYYDNQKEERNGMSVGPFTGFPDDYPSWYAQCEAITSVVFDTSFAGCTTLTSTASWFYDCRNLATISGMENLKTDNVTTMDGMFSGCSGLTSLNLSSFNTSNVTNMHSMFYDCRRLTSLDLSSFNTSNVTDMGYMFFCCEHLTSFDLSSFNTANVTDMRYMFYNCMRLTSLNLSSFNTSNVTDMGYMFFCCEHLISFDLSSFDTGNVTSMEHMFDGCIRLTSLDLSSFNTSNVTYMGYMFFECFVLTSLSLSSFNTENVVNMERMFANCKKIASLDLSGFYTSNVMNISSMFSYCPELATIYVGEGWNTAAILNYSGYDVFYGCSSLVGGKGTKYTYAHKDQTYARIDQGPDSDAPGYFTRSGDAPWSEPTIEAYAVLSDSNTVLTFYYDTQKAERNGMSVVPFEGASEREWNDNCKDITSVVFDPSFANDSTLTSTAFWFWGCSNLTTISGTENLNTSNVMDMKYMFVNCSSLISLDLSTLNTKNVTNISQLFPGCSSLTSLDLSGFNTSNVTDMSYMFHGCSSLVTVYVGDGWNTSAVTEGGWMFSSCSNLVGGKGTKYDGEHADYTYARIDQGPDSDAPGYFTDKNVQGLRKVWDFRNGFSSKTINALKADQEEFGPNKYWRNYEGDAEKADERHFWNASGEIKNSNGFACTHNGGMEKVIDELDGLKLGASNAKKFVITYDGAQNPNEFADGGLAIGEMVPHGKSYVWLNGKNETISFEAEVGQTIKIAVESHAVSANQLGEARGIMLTADGGTLIPKFEGDPIPTYYTEYEWYLTGDAGAKATLTIKSTNGCHIYYIIVGEGDAPIAPAEAYAVLSDNNTVLTFYYDNQKAPRNGMSVGPFKDSQEREWDNNSKDITSVLFDVSFANDSTLTSTTLWFRGFENLKVITGMENLNTTNVTDMVDMFHDCSSLASLDLSSFNTANVTNMNSMFFGCSSLASLNLSGFDTSNVTDMVGMFLGCASLTSLDLSSFNTSNVTNMNSMFSGCSSLTSLDLRGFNTENVTNMGWMFGNCSSLASLDLSSFNTSNVTAIWDMFFGCSSLVSLDLSSFNTEKVTNIYGMFNGCSGLTTIYAGEGWITANVTEGTEMFTNCSNLVGGKGTAYSADHADYTYARIDQGPDSDAPGYFTRSGDTPWVEPEPTEAYAVLSDSNTVLTFYYDNQKAARNGMSVGPFSDSLERGWDNSSKYITSVVFDLSFANDSTLTSTALWFRGFENLKVITGIENLNTFNVTDMSSMFAGCSSLTSLDLSGFNTANVTYMSAMFANCSSLTSLDVSGFKTDNVTGMDYMFSGCSGLTSLDVSGFKTDNVTYMGGMFGACSSLVSLNLSGFTTANVTSVGHMFSTCSSLTTIYVGDGWSTAAVTFDYDMFYGCSNLIGGMGTKYDADHIDHTYARIDQGPDSDAPGYFTRSGDIPWGEKSTFDGRVLTVRGSGSIDDALAQVGGFEQVDKTITAIVWEADVPYSGEAAFSNPNLLFYANNATKGLTINNLIYNGVAESITLTDEGEGNTDFYCPQSFTARSITYKRTFQQQTEIGVSRGWETIALPFTVQRISRVRSDEGLDRITPFGSSEGNRHFWLRRLTANGLQSVQTIEANTPYIIAMPNSEEYAAEYNLAGDIVFTAENATVAVTEPVSDRSADYELTANFERMAAQDSIYVLNVGAPRYGYPEGSIFEAGYRDLQPFRAYTRHINNGRPAPPYFALGELGGNSTTGISSVGDDTYVTDVWYDIQGRKLQGRPTQKGVYIHNGRKVIVK